VRCTLPAGEFDVGYGEGISRTGELIDIGIENRIIEKSGSWFSYGDVRLGQGRENAKRFLQENPDASAEIESKLRGVMGIGNHGIRAVPSQTAAPVPAAAPAKKHG
jgi:recombination protein RecA